MTITRSTYWQGRGRIKRALIVLAVVLIIGASYVYVWGAKGGGSTGTTTTQLSTTP